MAARALSRGVRSYRELLVQPGVAGVVGWGLVARMPIGMMAFAQVLLVRGAGASYADAGVVAAAGGIATAVGAPVAGRLVDRRRPAAVLAGYGVAYPAALVLLVVLAAAGAPLWTLVAAAVVSGATLPPVGPAVRMMWSSLVSDDHHPAAFALEATLQELVFVTGPLVVGGFTVAIASSAGVVAAGAFSLVGVAGLVMTGPVRASVPKPREHGRDPHPLAALAAPMVRRLLAFAVGYGVAYGAVEVAMPAFAEGHGGRSQASICLAAWYLGSFGGGLLVAGHRPADPVRLLRLISVVFAALLVLPLLADSVPAMAAIMFVVGIPIAPSVALAYGLVQQSARPGTQAEVFGWLSTAVVVGVALGAAAGGNLITHSGAGASILLGAAGVAAATVVIALPRPAG